MDDLTGDKTETLTITKGQLMGMFTVATADTTDENDQTFTVTLSNPAPASLAQLAADPTATGRIDDDDDPPTVDVADATATEGDNLEFEVTLSAASEKTVTVRLGVSFEADDTAKPADLGSTSSFDLTFRPEETEKTTVQGTVDDLFDEDAETFTILVYERTNVSAGDTEATGTINDNDDPPTVTVADGTASEGDDVEFAVTLSAVSGRDVEVDYATSEASPQSAVSGTDFTAATGDFTDLSAATGTLTFSASASQTTATVTVATREDTTDEADETFTVTLSNPSANAELGSGATAQGTIRDDDDPPAVSFGAATYAVDEGGSVEVTVVLSAPSGRPQVVVPLAHAAVGGASPQGGTAPDYGGVPASVTFAAGDREWTFTIEAPADAYAETGEGVALSFGTLPDGAAPGGVTRSTVSLNDVAVTVSFEQASYTAAEGGAAVAVALTLEPAVSHTLVVTMTARHGEGATAADYTGIQDGGRANFTPGQTRSSFDVTAVDDALDEAVETVTLGFTIPASATGLVKGSVAEATLRLTDDDDPPGVEDVMDASAREGEPVEFAVTLTEASGRTVNLDWEVRVDGVPASAADFDPFPQEGVLSFAPGVRTGTITVATAEDANDEADETFELRITGDGAVDLPGGLTVTGTIEDDDPEPALSVDDERATEGRAVEFTVDLSPASGKQVTVAWRASAEPGDTAGAGDFTAANGRLTFRAGERSKTVGVATSRDTLEEADETFTLTLSGVSNATLPDPPTARGTIENEVAPPPVAPRAEAEAGSYTSLEVRWGAPPPAGGLVLSGYELRYREHPEGVWTEWPHAGLGTTATITGLQVDTAYDIEVRAVYGELCSVWVRVPGSVRTAAPEPAVIRGVTVVNGPGSDGVWSTGERVEVEVRYSLPVVVEQPEYWENADGVRFPPGPYVLVAFRSDARPEYGESLGVALVPYVSGSGTATLRFAYPVGAAEAGARGVWAFNDGMLLRGATIRTLEGGKAASRYTRTGVSQVTVEPRSGAWTAGDRVRVKVRFTGSVQYTPPAEPQNLDQVEVTGGTPSIGLLLGDPEQRGLSRTASYERGSGTNTLTFEHQVTAGDGRVSAVEVVADSLVRNGATIRNERGYDVELNHLGTLWYLWSTLQVRDAAAREGGTLSFEMELSRAVEAPVTVDYETADGTATAGRDYTAQRGTVRFARGQTRRTVAVPVLRDEEAEDAETVVLRLSNARAEGTEAPVEVTVAEAQGMIEDVAPQVPSGGLTASFVDVPAAHDGQTAFTLRIAFSEPLSWMNGQRLREDVVAVSAGRATKAGRVNRRRDLWELTVEPDSLADVTVTLAGGAACDTPQAVCTADGRTLANTISTVVRGPVTVSVADARVREAPGATLDFAVTLSRAAAGAVTVDYRTVDGSARAGSDYTARQGTLSFAAGETEQTVRVAVLDDAHDEGDEKMGLVLYRASGAIRDDYVAVGTIENADPLPAAWLARFGRTAAGQVLAAVGERLRGGGQTQATVAGQRLQGADAAAVAAAQAGYERAWAERLQEGRLPQPARAPALRDLVAGSSFSVTAAADAGAEQAPSAEPGGRWTVWGRGAWSRFAGSAGSAAGGDLKVDGDVIGATAGADYERGALLAGLALAYSTGSGTYEHDSERSGSVASTLLSVHPYARLALHERLSVWGLFGYGLVGHLALDDAAADAIETGTGLLLGAFGVDGLLLAAAQSGGLELAARADGLLLRMSSEAATGLAASEADLSRWRLLLEASYAGLPLLGGELRPALAVGGRYDAGAAETGAGLVLSGRVSYALPAWGLTLSAAGEGLLVHQEEGFREWGAGGSLRFDPGAPGRGLALQVEPSWGVAGSGAGRLWALPDAASLAPAAAQPSPGARLAAELSYGLDAPGAAGALTPYAGVALAADGSRTWRLGTRLRLDSGLAVSLEGTRAEPVSATAQHALAAALSW